MTATRPLSSGSRPPRRPPRRASRPAPGRRGRGARGERGQALVEFALGLPLMLLIMLGTLDIGQIFVDYVALRNGCREGASYAARNPGAPEAIIRDKVTDNSPNLATGYLGMAVVYSEADFDPEVANGATVSITCEREYTPIMTGFLQTFFGIGNFHLETTATAGILK